MTAPHENGPARGRDPARPVAPQPRGNEDAPILELLQAAPQAMVIVDNHGRLLEANPRAEALLDRPRSALLGRLLDELVAPEFRSPLLDRIRASTIESGGSEDLNVSLQREGGGWARMGLTFLPFPSASGARICILLRDVNEARAEPQGAPSRRSQAVLDAVHQTGLNLRDQVESRPFFDMLLARATELIGTGHGRVRTVDRASNRVETLSGSGIFATPGAGPEEPSELALATGGKVLMNDVRLYAKDRSLTFHACLAVPMRAQGRVVGSLELLHAEPGRSFSNEDVAIVERLVDLGSIALENDWTRAARRATHEQDLARIRADADRDRKLSDLGLLISGVAHELRTPLTYVMNNLALEHIVLDEIAKGHPELKDELQGILEQNESSQQGLHRMMRVLQELRPLAQNKVRARVQVDLAQLVLDAVRTFRGSHDERVRIELDLQSTHPVLVDPDELVQVILNLLQNAVDATTGEGRIRVCTRNRDVPPEIRVSDWGPGVPPDLRERLFEPFYTTKPVGTGLGLVISRKIVEAHGGTLTYEDTPGGGATFVVRLPE